MRLAVLLTVYERLDYLPDQLNQLKNQTNKNFDLFICNNSNNSVKELQEIIPFTEVMYKNKYSIFGRIFMIRDYLLPEDYDAIFTIDDDETLPRNLIEQCFKQFDPKAIRSFWAFETYKDYWDRRRLKGSQTGDYAGTGGMLASTDFWRLDAIYEAPEEYWIIDDLWISHCALKHTDYVIKPLNVSMGFIPNEGTKATYRKIRPLKTQFHRKHIIPYRKNSKGASPN